VKRTDVVLVVMGAMGSGKTTIGQRLAARLGWDFLDADDFHSPANVEKMRRGLPLTDADRAGWLRQLRARIRRYQRERRSAVLACSALRRAYREALGVDQVRVKTVYLKGSYALLRRRVEGRRHRYMNKSLLRSQLEALEEPADGLTVDVSGTPAEIVREIVERMGLGSSAPAGAPEEREGER
jgi:gluconokinase